MNIHLTNPTLASLDRGLPGVPCADGGRHRLSIDPQLRSSLVQDEEEEERRLRDDVSWVALDPLSSPAGSV